MIILGVFFGLSFALVMSKATTFFQLGQAFWWGEKQAKRKRDGIPI